MKIFLKQGLLKAFLIAKSSWTKSKASFLDLSKLNEIFVI